MLVGFQTLLRDTQFALSKPHATSTIYLFEVVLPNLSKVLENIIFIVYILILSLTCDLASIVVRSILIMIFSIIIRIPPYCDRTTNVL